MPDAQRGRWRGCSSIMRRRCAIRSAAVPGIASRTSATHRAVHHRRGLRSGAKPSRAANRGALEAELGDLLFQVVFHAQMGAERRWFDFASVADSIADKLTERHPHVFARRAHRRRRRSESRLGRAQGARARGARRCAPSELADVPPGAAGAGARRQLGKRAGRVGFDWPDAQGVRAKIDEELGEIEARGRWRSGAAAPRNWATCCSQWRTGRGISTSTPKSRCDWPTPSSSGASAPWKSLRRERALALEAARRRPVGCACGTRSRTRKGGRNRRSVRIHRPLHTVASTVGISLDRRRLYVDQQQETIVSLVARLCRRRDARMRLPGPLRRSTIRRSESPYEQDPHDDRYDDAATMRLRLRHAWSTCSRWSRVCASALRSANAGMKPASTIVGMRNRPAAAVAGGDACSARVDRRGHRPPDWPWARAAMPATAGGARAGAAIGPPAGAASRGQHARRPPRGTRCSAETPRYHDEWQERIDGYRRDLRVQRSPPGDRDAVPPRRSHPRAGRREPGGVSERVVCHRRCGLRI